MACMKGMQHLLTSSSELQLLMVVVMTAPLLALATKSSFPDPHLREMSFDHLPLNDILFTNDVLLDVSVRSRLDCSKKCVETEGCVMCTFHSSPEGPPGLCRLHSQLKNGTDEKENRPGAKSVARRRSCEGDYVLACDRCLKAVEENVYYATAKQRCLDLQGQLVIPKSPTEVHCVGNFGYKKGFGVIWIGADDVATPGVIMWSDGTRLDDRNPSWADGEPNNKNNPGDVCASMGTFTFHFYDTTCRIPSKILCQRNVI